MRLGVNVDHIATIRQARMTSEPDPIYAAVLAEMAGADGITIHLRQDRRHIQERDLELLRTIIKSKLNLEMAVSMEMVKIALKYKPDLCTLVPETADEITTTGGLDVIMYSDKVGDITSNLQAAGLEVSAFVDPDQGQIRACHKLGINAVEINTGKYAETWNQKGSKKELEKIRKAATYAQKMDVKVLAGHGLTYQNVHPIVDIPEIEELNIGHSIVANAAFIGMSEAVRRMKKLISK
jgi:pyridoxine 5-phosphate synthase